MFIREKSLCSCFYWVKCVSQSCIHNLWRHTVFFLFLFWKSRRYSSWQAKKSSWRTKNCQAWQILLNHNTLQLDGKHHHTLQLQPCIRSRKLCTSKCLPYFAFKEYSMLLAYVADLTRNAIKCRHQASGNLGCRLTLSRSVIHSVSLEN